MTPEERDVLVWPERARDFSLVKHDGRAEACLLAEYGWRAGR